MAAGFCQFCGSTLTEGSAFCQNCGKSSVQNGGQYNNAGQPYVQQANYANYQQFTNPELTKPMTVGNWIVTYLLLLIPIANFILPFVWAFGSNVNASKKSWARAMLIFALIVGVLYAVFFATLIPAIMSAVSELGGSYY